MRRALWGGRGTRLTKLVAVAMRELDTFSALVGDIYDAALDPGLWSSALHKACQYIGAGAATLSSQETWRRTVHFHFLGCRPAFVVLDVLKHEMIQPELISRALGLRCQFLLCNHETSPDIACRRSLRRRS